MSGKEKFEREFEAFLNEEDSRLAALYRKLPQAEPDAKLDGAIRAMAHRALNPQLVATPRPYAQRRRLRWVPAFGVAAGVVLAAGIALRLDTGVRGDRDERGAPRSDVISVRPLDAPAPAAPPLSPAPPPAAELAQAPATTRAAAAKQQAPPAKSAAPEQAKSVAEPALDAVTGTALDDLKKAENIAAKPTPQAFPVREKERRRAVDAGQRIQEIAAGRWEDPYERKRDEAARATGQVAAAPATVPAPARRTNTAPAAATAAPAAAMTAPAAVTTGAAAPVAAPAAEAPALAKQAQPETDATAGAARESKPSTAGGLAPAQPMDRAAFPGESRQQAAPRAAAAPPTPSRADDSAANLEHNATLYPEHWLRNIRQLLRENKRDDALRNLAEFRKRYPSYHLPADLRDLR